MRRPPTGDQGDGVVFLSSGDCLLSGAITWVVSWMLEHPGEPLDAPLAIYARRRLREAAQTVEAEVRRSRKGEPSATVPLSRDKLADSRPAPSTWWSTTEAARHLGLDPSYLRRLARQGRLEARFAGKGWYLRAESAEAWAAKRRHGKVTDAA